MKAPTRDHDSPIAVVRKLATRRYLELVCVLVLVAGTASWWFAPADDGSVSLPLQFRINRAALSNLPVRVSAPRTCSCWTGGYVPGPDGLGGTPVFQISTRYRFSIRNGSRRALAIGGGETSTVRLLVAYPRSKRWTDVAVPGELIPTGLKGLRQTYRHDLPKRNAIEDADVYLAKNFTVERPSKVENGSDYGVPADYELWAVPSAPLWTAGNYLGGDDPTADQSQQSWTHVTAVEDDSQTLLPGHTYDDPRQGWSSWSFQLPVSDELGSALNGDPSRVPEPAEARRSLIPIGVAVLVPAADGRNTEMLGFAPVVPAASDARDDF